MPSGSSIRLFWPMSGSWPKWNKNRQSSTRRALACFDRLDDPGFDAVDERRLGLGAVDADGAGGVMRVRGVDQQMSRRNAARFFDFCGGRDRSSRG